MDGSDSQDLDTIFCAHFARIARAIGRVTQDQARAEELAVEVFLKWNRHPKAQGPHAEAWLHRTAVREALDELRRLQRRSRFERLFAFFHRSPPTPHQVYAASLERANVRNVLAALQQRQAELLLLWNEGLSYREMAAALEVNPSSIGSLLARAQEAFRKEYLKRYGK